jgi:NAD-dependent SIR2 family protein deacetylase
MNPIISNLVNQIRSAKDSGQKFALMLGAGASIQSGIKPTTQIMTELLARFGKGINGPDLRQKFNQLWAQWDEKQKNEYLMDYLKATPSRGYAPLARCVQRGYFDIVITFNFDGLLQKAFQSAGLKDDEDFKLVVRGDNADETVIALMELPIPRVKVLKLHGSLTGTTFLWSEREMLFYPEPIHNLVAQLTARPIVICGYGFQDTCVIRTFSKDGGAIYFVNKGGMPEQR